MFPIIFSFGPLVIYTWGVLLIIGIITAIYIFWRRATVEGYEEEKILDMAALSVFGGFLGSRVMWYLLHITEFNGDIFRVVSIFSYPGFSFWGGIVGAGLVGWWYAKKRHWNFWELADFVAIPAVFGQILSYFGHFLSGSAFGEPTRLFWGIRVPGFADFRHPVQVYVVVLLAAFLISLHMRSRRAFKKGTLILRALLGIGIILAITSFFRVDTLIFGLVKVSLIENLVAIGAVGYLWHMRTKRSWSEDLRQVLSFFKGSGPLIILRYPSRITKGLKLPSFKFRK